MTKTLGGTVALIADDSASSILVAGLSYGTDVTVIPPSDTTTPLHHDTILIGVCNGVQELATALRRATAARGRVFLVIDRQLVGADEATVSEPQLAESLYGLGISGIVQAEGLRAFEIEATEDQGDLARHLWLETHAELIAHTDSRTLLPHDNRPGTGELTAIDSARPTKKSTPKRSRRQRILNSLRRNKFVLLALVIALVGSVFWLAFAQGAAVAILWSMATLLLLVNLGVLLKLSTSVRTFQKKAAKTADLNRRLTKVMKSLAETRRHQLYSRMVETMILETLKDMEQK
ncbi:hypothetical protein SAMN06309944_2212 [Micrococcales bacterium KH10]|nr:hypothetical protein SAMN06309944_2212 [Micrococcales bacterium KH10]